MTGPDERNPLARAVDEAGDGPEARTYSIPVEEVRTRARRRRARRTVVTSGLAVLAIGAIAGGAYTGLPGLGGGRDVITHPGPQGVQGTTGAVDWPAQFDRCGQAAGDALPNVGGPMTLTLVDASSSVSADGHWNASVVADVPSAPAGDVAVVWATDLSVVANGIVVGVQQGPTAPPLSEPLNQRPEGLETNAFPVTTKVTQTLASCDQYPSAQGSPDLAPGTYTLVVTQTVSYAPPGAVTAVTDVRSSVLTSLTVEPSREGGPEGTASVGTIAGDWPAQFLRCGKQIDDALPRIGGDMSLALVDAATSVSADGAWSASVIADVPTANPMVSVWGTDLSVVKNGVVVGVQEGPGTPAVPLTTGDGLVAGPNVPLTPRPAGTSVASDLASCDQHPSAQGSPNLAPGTYDLVVTQTLLYWPAAGTDETFKEVRTSVTTTVTITAPNGSATMDPTLCGAPVEAIAALTSPTSNPAPVTLSTTFPPSPLPSSPDYPFTPRLTIEEWDPLQVVTSEPIVVAVRAGVVVGRGQRSGDRVDLGRMAPGDTHDYADPPLAKRCPGVAEPARGGTGLPAGDYQLWFVVDGRSTSPQVALWEVASGPFAWTVSEGS